jgi:hypothetical protein
MLAKHPYHRHRRHQYHRRHRRHHHHHHHHHLLLGVLPKVTSLTTPIFMTGRKSTRLQRLQAQADRGKRKRRGSRTRGRRITRRRNGNQNTENGSSFSGCGKKYGARRTQYPLILWFAFRTPRRIPCRRVIIISFFCLFFPLDILLLLVVFVYNADCGGW